MNQQYIDPWGRLVDHMGYPVAPEPHAQTQVFSPAPGEVVMVHEQMIPITQGISIPSAEIKPAEKLADSLVQTAKNAVKNIAKPKSVKVKIKPEETNPDLQCLFDCMVSMCGWLNELRTQAHLIHLNYSGSNFIPIHEFLKERYEEHQEQFDRIGEYVRTMDIMMPMCSQGLSEVMCGCEFEHCNSYNGSLMLLTYINNVEELGMKAKDLEKTAACVHAIDVQNYAAEIVETCFRTIWFLKSSIS